MGKKNLEQLFQETFKDFHEVPDEKVWKSIEASLDNKKQKRRIIPIWWRLGGVAALLAILFYVINPFEDNLEDGQTTITEVENNSPASQEDRNITDVENNPSKVDTSESITESSDNNKSDSKTGSDGSKASDKSLQIQQELVNNETKQNENRNDSRKNIIPTMQTDKENHALAGAEKTLNSNNETEVLERRETTPEKTLLENIKKEETKAIAETEIDLKDKTTQKKSVSDALERQNEEKEAIAETNEVKDQPEKKSIFEVIQEQEEETLLAENKKGKWSVGPSVAPVYYNATGGGSPIHSDFAPNSKSGNINLSYGLTVAYDLGKRLKIRSGVHKVNYGYDTNDVVFSSSLQASSDELIDNISYSQTSRTLVLQSKNDVRGQALSDASLEVTANEATALEGKMVQQLGYVEVPLELNYTLLAKKFGVDLIGGVSSLFLVDNSVLVESDNLVTEVGEANNANSVNFSTNVGIGLNYKFTPKVQFNVEPVFKYHMNTFSSTSGAFRPYSVGVYSGISFKF